MASVWIACRPHKSGGQSFRVMFRVGGRESMPRYGGSFKTLREAKIRRDWIAGELAALRIPDLRLEAEQPPRSLRVAAECRQASRVDVAEDTRTRHGLELARILPRLGDRRIEEITPGDVSEFVATLVGEGYARGTIRKTLQTLAMVPQGGDDRDAAGALDRAAPRAR
jgi:hypothetical protein